jgi:beta-N-acetylhexosaminidase
VTRRVRRHRTIAGLLALALLAGAGVLVAALAGGGNAKTPLPPPAAGTDQSQAGHEVIVASGSGAKSTARSRKAGAVHVPRSVRREAAKLSLQRQVAQLFAVGFTGYYPRAPFFERFKARDWGAVILERRNFQSESQIGQLAGEPGAVANDNGLTAPIVGAAQVGGDVSAFPGLGPTAPPDVGASGSAKRAHDEAKAAAQRLRGLGLSMTLAPVADIAVEASPSADSAFSGDPRIAARMVSAAVKGYRQGALIPAVGHFPGQGSASQDPQAGPATVGLSLAEIKGRELRPFAAAIAAGAPVVMMSSALYAAYDGITPAVLLPAAHALLRQSGFHGVVMTDDLISVQAATGAGIGSVAVGSLRAGADLLYLSGDSAAEEAAYQAVLGAVRKGDLSRGRIRDSVLKILDLKRRFKVGKG